MIILNINDIENILHLIIIIIQVLKMMTFFFSKEKHQTGRKQRRGKVVDGEGSLTHIACLLVFFSCCPLFVVDVATKHKSQKSMAVRNLNCKTNQVFTTLYFVV